LSAKWGASTCELEKFAGSDRQILPGHGQFFPASGARAPDTRNMIFRSREKSMFKQF
jgi:hypothetical protein